MPGTVLRAGAKPALRELAVKWRDREGLINEWHAHHYPL